MEARERRKDFRVNDCRGRSIEWNSTDVLSSFSHQSLHDLPTVVREQFDSILAAVNPLSRRHWPTLLSAAILYRSVD